MQALTVEAPGGWAHAAVREVDVPQRRAGCALVAIHAVGLNPADNDQIHGRYPGGPKPPFTPGRDGAGIVLEADDTGRWNVGDEVIVLQSSTTDLVHGTLCEQQWIAAENLAPLPAGWTLADGAAAPLVYLTAYQALTSAAAIVPGQVVLVTGASGGVGIAAVQLALALGARVIALSRSADKRELLHGLGVEHVFSPEDPELKKKIRDVTGRRGVDVVVENVGGSSLGQAVHLLDFGGRVSVVGVRAGIEGAIPIPAFMFKRASLHGILLTTESPEASQKNWRTVVDLLQTHHAEPVIAARYPLARTADAFAHLAKDVFGKVIVTINATESPIKKL